jgi:hypothetical protein
MTPTVRDSQTVASIPGRAEDSHVLPSELGGEYNEVFPERSNAEPPTYVPDWPEFDLDQYPEGPDPVDENEVNSGPPLSDAPEADRLSDARDSTDDLRDPDAIESLETEICESVKETAKAFFGEGIRLGAHAVGLGLVYEVFHWTKKAVDAAEALGSDQGAYLSLPIPVAHLDFMIRLRTGDQADDQPPPVTLFVAPGEDSLAAAIELNAVEESKEDKTQEAAEADGPAVTSEPASQYGRERDKHRKESRRTDYEWVQDVQIYGGVVVAKMDLSDLASRSRIDRLVALQQYSAYSLREGLNRLGSGIDLFIGFDESMGTAFWVRVASNQSKAWRINAEFRLATHTFAIEEPETLSELELPRREVRAILRSTGSLHRPADASTSSPESFDSTADSRAQMPVPSPRQPFTSADAEATLATTCSATGLHSQDADLLRLGENAIFRLALEPVVVRIARSLDVLSDAAKAARIDRS